MDFWDRVKTLTKERGTKLSAVATAAGQKVPTFNGWITREIMPNADQACYIARALDTTVEFLVSGSDRGDPWVSTHHGFLADCKDLPEDQFLTFARVIFGAAEDARKRRRSTDLTYLDSRQIAKRAVADLVAEPSPTDVD